MEFPTLTTNRLCLRPFQSDDWQPFHAYASNPNVMTYIPEGALDIGQAKAFVQKQVSREAEAIAVLLPNDDQLIGHLSFHPWFAKRTFEIGWVFHPDYYGQGYATEAAHALLAVGFETLNLHRIIATCQPENPASFRVMEKLGMRREGHFQSCIPRGNGVWWDEYFYAILAEEWFKDIA